MRKTVPHYPVLFAAVKLGKGNTALAEPSKTSPTGGVKAWESFTMEPAKAREIAEFMNAHSSAASLGVARNGNFDGVRRLLDVGAGSGAFSIALAERYPDMHCTLMDLQAMCDVAMEYVVAHNLTGRIDSSATDMFRQPWPKGYEAIFLSNILHDWSAETCAKLAQSAAAALGPGGRIYLYEMLLDDEQQGPPYAAAFSVQMLVATRGRQYSFRELSELLQGAGFTEVQVTHTYGYYSLVSARMP
jgi:acetylserotonin N-methyltransferase